MINLSRNEKVLRNRNENPKFVAELQNASDTV